MISVLVAVFALLVMFRITCKVVATTVYVSAKIMHQPVPSWIKVRGQ